MLTEEVIGFCFNDEHSMKTPFQIYTKDGGNTKFYIQKKHILQLM